MLAAMTDAESTQNNIAPSGSISPVIPSPSTTLNVASTDIEKQDFTSPKELSTSQLWKARLERCWPRANAQPEQSGTIKNDDLAPKVRKLTECEEGYPRLAAFLDSDDNFMIFRRFGYVQTRLILEKQDKMRVLENRLDKFDKSIAEIVDPNDPDERYGRSRHLRGTAKERAEYRKTLMNELETLFCEYAQLMEAAQSLVKLNKPASKDYTSVLNYFRQTTPVEKNEEQWITRKEDLITLRPGREHAWLDSFVEHLLKWGNCRFTENVFCSKETRNKTDGLVVYYTRSRVNMLVISIIVLILLALLIVPIYILYHLVLEIGNARTDAICIGVILVFTLGFSTILSLFTRAQRHEILAAAAGYAAVLVVFLGNVAPGGGMGFAHQRC